VIFESHNEIGFQEWNARFIATNKVVDGACQNHKMKLAFREWNVGCIAID
jgi:hypothetical protein